MLDSRVILADGTGYDARWALSKYGATYKVRDAMVLGFWMTPFSRTCSRTTSPRTAATHALSLPP
jgi:hypothetical protein